MSLDFQNVLTNLIFGTFRGNGRKRLEKIVYAMSLILGYCNRGFSLFFHIVYCKHIVIGHCLYRGLGEGVGVGADMLQSILWCGTNARLILLLSNAAI